MARRPKITHHLSCAAFPTKAELNPLNHLAVPHRGHRGGRLMQLSFPQQNDRCASFKMTCKGSVSFHSFLLAHLKAKFLYVDIPGGAVH